MKVLDETGMGVFWALVKEYIANHVEDVTNSYLPLSGGTLTGGLNINSYGGLTTTGTLTTSSGLKTTSWKSWMMRNGGDDDNIAAIWYVDNDTIKLCRTNPDDMDLSDPPVLFTLFSYNTNNAIWLCDGQMYISKEGIFHTRQLVSDNHDLISGYGSLELYSTTPYIDFHYDSSQEDYTSRIIESESGTLTIPRNFAVNGSLTMGPNSPGINTKAWLCSTMINDSGDGATGCYKFYCNNDAVLLTSHSAEDVDNSVSQSKYTYFIFYDSTQQYRMNFAGNKISFYQNGRIMATEFYENSDITLKENVDSISKSDLGKIEDVEFKEFNFIDDEDKTKKYGVIAQEVEEAGLDNLVSTNAEGKKAVDYISLLVLKIQALEKRVAELEAERR